METRIQKLHEEAKEKAVRYRESENALLDVLVRLDQQKVFIAYGYPSLYEYCLRELGLSEPTACSLITVARKTQEIPELKKELQLGNLSVSKIRKMTAILTPQNAPVWIEKAKSMTHKALEKEVAKEKPEVLVPVGSQYISEDRLALQVCISEKLMEQLARLRDILSQRKQENVSLEKALEVVVGAYLEKHDPLEKAARAVEKADKQPYPSANLHFPGNVKPLEVEEDPFQSKEFERLAIRNMIKHEVMYRDRGQCTFVHPNGKRCRERRYLEIHHIKPLSQGGPDTAQNLTLLCSAHHKHIHLRHHCRPVGLDSVQRQKSLGFLQVQRT